MKMLSKSDLYKVILMNRRMTYNEYIFESFKHKKKGEDSDVKLNRAKKKLRGRSRNLPVKHR